MSQVTPTLSLGDQFLKIDIVPPNQSKSPDGVNFYRNGTDSIRSDDDHYIEEQSSSSGKNNEGRVKIGYRGEERLFQSPTFQRLNAARKVLSKGPAGNLGEKTQVRGQVSNLEKDFTPGHWGNYNSGVRASSNVRAPSVDKGKKRAGSKSR